MSNQTVTLEVAEKILKAAGTAGDIATMFNVSHQTVRLYKSLKTGMAREAAANLAAMGESVTPLPNSNTHKFSPEDVAEIRASQASSKDEAERWGCSASLIRMIKTGAAYADV